MERKYHFGSFFMLRLYYYKDHRGNFGDDLNLYLWPKVFPNLVNIDHPVHAFSNQVIVEADEKLFVGIGSLLNHHLPTHCNKVIFGSGFGYGEVPAVDDRWAVFAVRGPITAAKLNLDPAVAITDSAVLVRNFLVGSVDKRFRCSFFAYHETAETIDWRNVCRMIGIHYIDPSDKVDSILHQIQQSDQVICEGMHGAIVADALRVPWVPVKISRTINELKWQDWCSSLNLEYRAIKLAHLDPGIARQGIKRYWKKKKITAIVCKKLFHISRNDFAMLSSDHDIQLRTEQLSEKADLLKKHLGRQNE
jgi:succinoglycan biosynthesis protein ExoV